MQKVIITAPSLDPAQNVSGVSSVVQFIIDNNKRAEYRHFQIGKADKETGLWNRISRIFKTYKDWKKTLATCPEALIHYSFPLSTPSILRDPAFMWYALRHKRKMVVHVHGGLFLTAPTIPYLQTKILKWVFNWNVPFVVLSDGEKGILQERWGVKDVEVLPNCPEEAREGETRENETRVGETRDERGTLVLGYLGRIEVNKGMGELLEACKRLKNDGILFKLRIAGKEETEGEYIPRFEKMFQIPDSKCFEYVGLVSGETKKEFLRSLDVLVMPTYFEGLPMSLLECMSYGVVPVITNVGSIATVVKGLKGVSECQEGANEGSKGVTECQEGANEGSKGVSECQEGANEGSKGVTECQDANGLFIKVKDVDSIVDAVKYLNEHRDVMKQLSSNARKTIKDNFSAEKYVEKLNGIYGREA